MTWPEVADLFEYWDSVPPLEETAAIFARAYTSWEPANAKPMTPEEHMDSLEARWASGQYLNPKQMFEAMGGKILAPGADLNHPWANAQLPGIGPFPGMVDKVR